MPRVYVMKIEIQWSIIIDIITCIVHAWLDDTFFFFSPHHLLQHTSFYVRLILCLYLKRVHHPTLHRTCIIIIVVVSFPLIFHHISLLFQKNLFCLNHFELTGGSRGPMIYSLEYIRLLQLLNRFWIV